MKDETFEALKLLIEEILINVKKLIEQENNLCMKQGKIIKKENFFYTIEIEKKQYTAKSKFIFQEGEIVTILTDKNLENQLYILPNKN